MINNKLISVKYLSVIHEFKLTSVQVQPSSLSNWHKLIDVSLYILFHFRSESSSTNSKSGTRQTPITSPSTSTSAYSHLTRYSMGYFEGNLAERWGIWLCGCARVVALRKIKFILNQQQTRQVRHIPGNLIQLLLDWGSIINWSPKPTCKNTE